MNLKNADSKGADVGKKLYIYAGVVGVVITAFDFITAEVTDLIFNFRMFSLPVSKIVSDAILNVMHFGSTKLSWNRNVYVGSGLSFRICALMLGGLIYSVVWFLYNKTSFKDKLGKFISVLSKGFHDTSHTKWAVLKDLSDLIVTNFVRGRLVFGRFDNRLIAGENNQSLLVIGPTQSRKTTGFCIPALLEWEGPIIATSVKTDLVDLTIGYRSTCGNVNVIDPSSQSGYPKSLWSPVTNIKNFSDAKKISAFMSMETSGQSGLDDSRFWYQCAAKLLAPMLFAASKANLGIEEVITWTDTQAVDVVTRLLIELDEPKALQAFESTIYKEERQRSSIFTTLESVLEPYSNITGDTPLFSTGKFLEGNNTLYLISPAHEQHRLKDYFSTVVGEVVRGAFETVTRTSKPIDPPLLIVLDEAANIAPVSELDTLASTAASNGIQIVSIFQDIAQIYTRYGSRASTIINNHRAKIVLSGLSDVDNIEKLSVLGGSRMDTLESVTTDKHGNRSLTQSPQSANLLSSSVLRQLEPGCGFLVYGHLPPAKLSLRLYFQDEKLLSKSRLAFDVDDGG